MMRMNDYDYMIIYVLLDMMCVIVWWWWPRLIFWHRCT
jgi:hypothetical protein